MFSQGSFRNPSSLYSSAGDRDQPTRQPTQGNKVLELKEEEFHVHPKVSQMFSESSNKDMKMIPVRDAIPEEAAKTQKIKEIADLAQRLEELKDFKGGNDPSVRVITLAGENRGATMDFNGSENDIVDIHRGYKSMSQDQQKKEGLKASSTDKGTYVNSNVQGINNSIVYNSSCSNRDPGVHMGLNNNPPIEEGPVYPHDKSPRRGSKIDSKPPEISLLPAPADPHVKRRCLRALFLESSSDDSSPERSRDRTPKQRRHGCRHECEGHGKCKENTANNQHGQEQKLQHSDENVSEEKPKPKCSCFGSRLLRNKQV